MNGMNLSFNKWQSNLYNKKNFMKKRTKFLFALPFIFLACNNDKTKDSVETADSVNKARTEKADSMGAYRPDAATTDFLVKAANAGMAEVRLGEIASEKGVNKKVKELGEMMVKDHGAGNAAVKSLAAPRNISLPAMVDEDEQKMIDDLSAKKGKDFDKAYIKQMIKDHENAIDLFKNAVDKVNDTEVRNFANNTLPKLQMHLESFKEVEKTLK